MQCWGKCGWDHCARLNRIQSFSYQPAELTDAEQSWIWRFWSSTHVLCRVRARFPVTFLRIQLKRWAVSCSCAASDITDVTCLTLFSKISPHLEHTTLITNKTFTSDCDEDFEIRCFKLINNGFASFVLCHFIFKC